eukprot:scaffold25743_cov123-Isochrysis_galbana.AAC.2
MTKYRGGTQYVTVGVTNGGNCEKRLPPVGPAAEELSVLRECARGKVVLFPVRLELVRPADVDGHARAAL